MNISEYKNIYENEDEHFYYVSLHNLVISLIKKYQTSHPLRIGASKLHPATILDAGCGTGLLVKKMSVFGKVEGIDKSSEALKFAKKRGVKTTLGSITKLPFKNNAFDVVTSIDVIYHKWVNNDQKALDELYRVIKPKGVLILRVPAISWLKLKHDEYVYGERRYNLKNLRSKLIKAKFKIEKISYVNFSLVFPAIFKYFSEKLKVKKNAKSNITRVSGVVNQIMNVILSFENLILMIFGLPIGLGVIAVVRKTSDHSDSLGGS